MVLDDSVLRRNEALRDLMRFARIIVEDGDVTEAEAVGIRAWIEANPDVRGLRHVDDIMAILKNVLDDGRLSESERRELAEQLESFGG